MNDMTPDAEALIKLANTRMPFGKYTNWYLVDIPEPYLVWYNAKGFPKGTMGDMLRSMYEIKVNGLEYLLMPLVKRQQKSQSDK